jgi:hypothetical protein
MCYSYCFVKTTLLLDHVELERNLTEEEVWIFLSFEYEFAYNIADLMARTWRSCFENQDKYAFLLQALTLHPSTPRSYSTFGVLVFLLCIFRGILPHAQPTLDSSSSSCSATARCWTRRIICQHGYRVL